MTKLKYLGGILCALFLIYAGHYSFTHYNFNKQKHVGQVIDVFNGVNVYYNGGVNHVKKRNVTADGYNLGLEYQCVEFVKRYYYEYLHHKMPDTYGHAKSFFQKNLADGALNTQRNLLQYHNNGKMKPEVNDLVVYDASIINRFGHVAIISNVGDDFIEIIQQNAGPFKPSREIYPLIKTDDNHWLIKHNRIRGFLRRADSTL